jgi:hypothetical protein
MSPATKHYGAAMAACAAELADHCREVDDGVVCNAFWRGDPKVTVKIFTTTGAWSDAKTGESGGARDFARLNGMTLRQLLRAFPAQGRVDRSPTPQVPLTRLLPPLPPLPDIPGQLATQTPAAPTFNAQAVWDAAVSDTASKERARSYLANDRGLGSFVAAINDGYAGLNAAPCVVGERLATLLGEGVAVAVPLRDVYGQIANVAFRLTHPRDGQPKCVTLPGSSIGVPGRPVGFGNMRAAGNARILLIAEGLMDTLVAQALVGPDVIVIGAHSASQLGSQWANAMPRALSPGTQIHLLPHMDGNGVGMKAMSELHRNLVDDGKQAAMVRWSRVLGNLGIPEIALGVVIKDLADLLRVRSPEMVSKALKCAMGVTR